MPKMPVIAIVDDDESFRRATTSFVRSLGYGTASFDSAEAFLKSEQISDADCLITDVQMPGENRPDNIDVDNAERRRSNVEPNRWARARQVQ